MAGRCLLVFMVLHHPYHPILAALRKFGVAAAFVGVMVSGTALLIALVPAQDNLHMVDSNGKPITAAEMVMSSATERALVSPRTAILASTHELNERRGF